MKKSKVKKITGYFRKDIEGVIVRCINCLNTIIVMWYPIHINEIFIFNCLKCGKEYIYKVIEIKRSGIIFEIIKRKKIQKNK